MTQDLDHVLGRLGLRLPAGSKPVGTYRPLILAGGFAYLSGQISRDAEGNLIKGKAGKDLTVDQARRAAQLAVLQAVSLIRDGIGFEKLEQVLRMVGFVQSAGDFYGQSDVMNAASELLVEIFGEKGRHARTSIGAASLPLDAAVEIELTLKLR